MPRIRIHREAADIDPARYSGGRYVWPFSNVILGVSVEDQPTADARLPLLARLGAAGWQTVASFEPLLAGISLDKFIGTHTCYTCSYRGFADDDSDKCPDCGTIRGDGFGNAENDPRATSIHHIIVGGESGPGARPMHPDRARLLRDQAVAAGARFFFKGWGHYAPVPPPETLHGGPNWVMSPGDIYMLPNGDYVTLDQQDVDDCAHGMWECELKGDDNRGEFLRPFRSKKQAGRILDGRIWDEPLVTAKVTR